MFWRMAGLSTASPVETILDKDNFTLEELLDEDEIIQECKALNGRLINFLRDRAQVEKLIQYIVEEPTEDAEKQRTFKLPFIACEIFTCEVDIILKTLVEDEELMNLLFSFLEPTHSHGTLLAGYFSKVCICLLLRKTVPFLNYVKAHQEIFGKLVDLIGITSIMEVLIRLIGADEHLYSSYTEAMQWIHDTNVLELIVDKFSSSDFPEVHANTAETLCAITRFAPPGLAAKISSPKYGSNHFVYILWNIITSFVDLLIILALQWHSFIGRLFRHALEESRPKSVLVNSLSICICLLDPRRLNLGTYHTYNRQLNQGTAVSASPTTVEGMLESLGDLLKLLDVSSTDHFLLTTYGKLQPPLGKHRLKIVEFISVILTIGSEAAEKELIRLRAIQRILDLFFDYPYNNFLHHHVESIIFSCFDSKNGSLCEHLLRDCSLVTKILEAEMKITLTTDLSKPTVPAEGRSPPRIGNIGHLTRISNKLVQLANNSSAIQALLQENNQWVDWQSSALTKRNVVENVHQWACGRPTAMQDRRDSDDDDYQDRDYDVAALANNLSQAFQYGIYNNDDMDEVRGSLERDDEDVYFDDESAEVVISSLRLGDDQDSSSLFTNSNWFAFEDDRVANERSDGSLASLLNNEDGTGAVSDVGNKNVAGEDDNLEDTATSSTSVEDKSVSKDSSEGGTVLADDIPSSAWVEWRETPDVDDSPGSKQHPAPSDGGNLEGGEGNLKSSEQPTTDVALVESESTCAGGSTSDSANKEKQTCSSSGSEPSSSVGTEDKAGEVVKDADDEEKKSNQL
ncbi:Serine/threonine-protein phosphatase 6 regulatory subunit 3 [Linum perenne]